MAKWLASGEVDLYFDSPYPALIVSDASGAKLILQRWKDGVEQYNSIIFTHRDNNIRTLDDLPGKTIAFEEEFSTAGYFLPLTHLLKMGFNLTEKPSAETDVVANEIGYVFSAAEENTIEWVLSKQVMAAGIGSVDFQEISAEVRAQLTVISETQVVPRHVVVASSKLTPRQLEVIQTLLTTMEETETGKSILDTFEQTSQFNALSPATNDVLMQMQQQLESANRSSLK
jgi:phosphonate transport system substrate-binding protein